MQRKPFERHACQGRARPLTKEEALIARVLQAVDAIRPLNLDLRLPFERRSRPVVVDAALLPAP